MAKRSQSITVSRESYLSAFLLPLGTIPVGRQRRVPRPSTPVQMIHRQSCEEGRGAQAELHSAWKLLRYMAIHVSPAKRSAWHHPEANHYLTGCNRTVSFPWSRFDKVFCRFCLYPWMRQSRVGLHCFLDMRTHSFHRETVAVRFFVWHGLDNVPRDRVLCCYHRDFSPQFVQRHSLSLLRQYRQEGDIRSRLDCLHVPRGAHNFLMPMLKRRWRFALRQ